MSPDSSSSTDFAWRKARCESGSCVEVASAHGMVVFRSSKEPDGLLLQYTPDEWNAFLKGAKDGDFDGLV
ncbi:MAG TPA: DUF397 domain-containing protein [Streptosporangiaceae bacterium]|nr:DUF397 domain-containing protein [Streptosporangiaceae bacterium]